jgi:hypothetical protein
MTDTPVDLHLGDCLQVMKTLPSESVHAVVTDPPYGIDFMAKGWDHQTPGPEVWAEALRLLKPGGWLVAFAGTRTQHRMASAIEDAGFEIRDMLAWIYGSGFPKSLDVAKAIDAQGQDPDPWQGWGTALKPCLEPITLARKPLTGTVADNVLTHGAGGLNIDGCRVPHDKGVDLGAIQRQQAGATGRAMGLGFVESLIGKEIPMYKAGGRWPPNLLHDGSKDVVDVMPVDQGGSVARFFYCPKASRSDRDEGLTGRHTAQRDDTRKPGLPGSDNPYNRGAAMRHNFHPTVKPTELMRWLVRLVTPEGGTVLDPFMGSGSTGKAAKLEGHPFIGIEMSADYLEIARARIWARYTPPAPDDAQHQGDQLSLLF